MPAEVKVLGWRKGERSGMVVHGAGGPGAQRQARRPRRPGRRPGALGREGGVRLPRRVRRRGPVVDDARPDAGLLRHAQAAGDGCRLARRERRPVVLRRAVAQGEVVAHRRRPPPALHVCGLFCCPKSSPVLSIPPKWGAVGAHVRAAALPRRLPLVRAAPHLQRLAGQLPRPPRRGVPRLDAEDRIEVLDGALEPGRVHAGDPPAVEDVLVPGVEVDDPAVVLYRPLVLLQAAVGQPTGSEGLGVAGL